MIVHSISSGWESLGPAQAPAPLPSWPQLTLPQHDLLRMIQMVRNYIHRTPEHTKPDALTWYDEIQLAFHFNSKSGNVGLSPANFSSICLTYFSTCWT